ncbi:MAG: ParB/RepB/Spo0J family partition protein [Oscillospiraceae bacterium]|nr:ParB/RepB/Spo0J family partition protein [Oscillospiraceae bacterium]
MAKSGLGRGLGSLFDDTSPAAEEENNVESLRISQIEPNKNQPRQKFDDDKIDTLADSIKEHGVIQPIIVVKSGKRYKIVAGERRWRAAKKAGLKEIPVVIRDYTDREIAQIALIENLQRENLNPIEEALGYRTLMNKFDMTQEEVSSKIGKSRSAVANSIRLLSLDEAVQSKLISGEISSGHARALLSIEDPEIRKAVLLSITEKELNVRQAEALARELQKAKPKKKTEKIDEQLRAELDSIENGLSSQLGTKVRLIHNDKRGKIEIEYFGNDDLERILNIIRNGGL